MEGVEHVFATGHVSKAYIEVCTQRPGNGMDVDQNGELGMIPEVIQEIILIVDDIPANIRIVADTLVKKGLHVVIAQSGEQALQIVERVGPDIILMDVVMPEMDGFETCRQLKLNEDTRAIPVIFMTALDDPEYVMQGFDVGGVDYIAKPVRIKEVVARVETHLRLRKMQQQLETQNARLQEALDNIKTLKGLLPICANCKKIRDDQGYWKQIEAYIEDHSDALFTHGLCPECLKRLIDESAIQHD
jgi:PleD family two-component response regulator